MIWLTIGIVAIVLGGLVLWFLRKAGEDAYKADHNEQIVDDIEKVNRARADRDLVKRVRDKFKR